MSKYFKYLRYVIRHKFYVMIYCFKFGLYWQGLTHDLHKLRWFPFVTYANHFYGGKKVKGNSPTGYAKPTTDLDDPAFDLAWLYHQKSQRHHWQFFVLMEDDGGVKLMPMPDKYWKEMVVDWYGASIATGRSDRTNYKENTKQWYIAHKNIIQMNGFTRAMVEQELGV